MKLRSIELCSGAGGQALGLARAGFEHAAIVDLDADACSTILTNRPKWPAMPAWSGARWNKRAVVTAIHRLASYATSRRVGTSRTSLSP